MKTDGTFKYFWDAENRLIGVEPDKDPNDLVQGDKKLEFKYDYMGRRVEKRVYTHNGSSWDLSTTRRFMYYNWLPLLELDVTNPGDPNETITILRKYTWGLDLAGQSGGPASGRSNEDAGGIGGLLATYDADSSKSYIYLYDANGNVGQLIDRSDGSLDAKYEYDAYGNTIASGGDYADDNPFRFSTKYFDDELDYAPTTNDGLYYFGYRYYTPRLGRWLNRDPLHELDTWSLYRFVWNNPASGYDPDGLQTTQPSTQPATFPCVGVGFTDTWLTGPILLDQFVSDQWPGSGGPGVITGAAKEVTFVWGRQHAQIFACCVDGALKFLWGEPSLAWQIRPVSVPLEHAFLVKAWQVSVSWHNVEIISLRSAWTPYDEDGHREMKRLAQSPQGRPAPGQWKRQLAKPPKGGRRIGSGEKFGCGYWPPHKEVRKKAGKPPKPVPWPKKLP